MFHSLKGSNLRQLLFFEIHSGRRWRFTRCLDRVNKIKMTTAIATKRPPSPGISSASPKCWSSGAGRYHYDASSCSPHLSGVLDCLWGGYAHGPSIHTKWAPATNCCCQHWSTKGWKTLASKGIWSDAMIIFHLEKTAETRWSPLSPLVKHHFV